jgi:hypothetical protein
MSFTCFRALHPEWKIGMVRKLGLIGALVVGALILAAQAAAASAVARTNAGGKYVHYGSTNAGGKYVYRGSVTKFHTNHGGKYVLSRLLSMEAGAVVIGW